MSEFEFTPDQIEHGIACAIEEHKFNLIPSLLKLLAVQDPTRAQTILGQLRAIATLASALGEGS